MTIGDNVFIGANSTILPDVRIGNQVIIGANSVVTKDIENNSIVVGNPARRIGSYSDYMYKQKSLMEIVPVFDESYTIGAITDEKKKEMKKALSNSVGFVR